MTPIPFAVIGTGRIATDYLTALRDVPELVLTGVADLRADVAAAVGERWSCPWFETGEELLASTGARAVLVAVPPFAHEETALACLARGAHVLCEKPFALDVASGRRMLAAAADAGSVLTMSAKFRHVPDVVEAKARIGAGVLGDVVLASNVFASEVEMRGRWNADPSRSGGGVLIDNGTHSADLLRYLLGPIVRVQATTAPAAQALDVEDTVSLTAGFASGAIAHVTLSWSLSAHLPWYLAAHGTSGSLFLGWRERSRLQRRGDRDTIPFGIGYDKVDALRRQLAHFARAVRGEEPPAMSPADILASIGVVEAGYASLREGGAVVRVDAEPGT